MLYCQASENESTSHVCINFFSFKLKFSLIIAKKITLLIAVDSVVFYFRFTSGFELANLVVNSNLLHLSWSSICALQAEANPFHHHQQQPLSLRCRVDKQLNFTIVALGTSPSCLIHHLQQEGDLVSSIALKQENFPLFEFLCSKGNPSFSINRAAIALFYRHFSELSLLRTQVPNFSYIYSNGDFEIAIFQQFILIY